MASTVRVAIVNHGARPGGGEVDLLHIVTRLDPERVSFFVVLGEEGMVADELRQHGVDVVVVPLDRRLGQRRKGSLGIRGLADPVAVWLLARAVWRLRAELRRRGVNVVHTNSLKAHVWGGLAGRLAAAQVLWHVRDHIAPPYLPAPAAAAVRVLARVLPHHVVAVSLSVARTLGVPATVVNHGVGLPPPAPEQAPRSPDGRLRAGLVGRIAAWKGQDVFIAAAERLAPDFPEAEFLVVGAPLFGEEELEKELRERVERAQLGERVRFLGFRGDIWTIYRQLDVAVHASTLPEPYGNVVLEAMASVRPIVAAAAGGVLELVEHGRTGLLVPPGDPIALADAVASLLRSPDERRRLAAAGRRDVEERFSPGRDTLLLERLWRATVDRPRRR